jgi:hypothetical protein
LISVAQEIDGPGRDTLPLMSQYGSGLLLGNLKAIGLALVFVLSIVLVRAIWRFVRREKPGNQ